MSETKKIFIEILNQYWEGKLTYEESREMIIALGD
jgi:hypothetical protein